LLAALESRASADDEQVPGRRPALYGGWIWSVSIVLLRLSLSRTGICDPTLFGHDVASGGLVESVPHLRARRRHLEVTLP